tara:strand:+ start:2862 stop:3782 length:921 start_codon:yes stop_codon:yes gene_type:complete
MATLNVRQSLRFPSSAARRWEEDATLDERLEAAEIIAELASRAGLSKRAQAAMIINAYKESKLDRDIVQPGVSVPGIGLFQLTSSDYTPHEGGYARGHRVRKGTRQQRMDPVHNTMYMLYEMLDTSFGYRFLRADRAGASVGELAYIFAQDLERCACCGDSHPGGVRKENRYSAGCIPKDRDAVARKNAAASLFPTLETGGTRYIVPAPAPNTTGAPRDVAGEGGWTYRQWPDGTIKIIGAPSGHSPGGLFAPGSPTNVAITNEIGDYPPIRVGPPLWVTVGIGTALVAAFTAPVWLDIISESRRR